MPVLDAADLPDDTPTRAEVNGHAVVLLRLRGELHAFQEFCTHRYGPLSEGKIDGAQHHVPLAPLVFRSADGQSGERPGEGGLEDLPRPRRGRADLGWHLFCLIQEKT